MRPNFNSLHLKPTSLSSSFRAFQHPQVELLLVQAPCLGSPRGSFESSSSQSQMQASSSLPLQQSAVVFSSSTPHYVPWKHTNFHQKKIIQFQIWIR